MLKTLAKLTLLIVLASLFTISQAQIVRRPPPGTCIYNPTTKQCINHACSGGCEQNGTSCTCLPF